MQTRGRYLWWTKKQKKKTDFAISSEHIQPQKPGLKSVYKVRLCTAHQCCTSVLLLKPIHQAKHYESYTRKVGLSTVKK